MLPIPQTKMEMEFSIFPVFNFPRLPGIPQDLGTIGSIQTRDFRVGIPTQVRRTGWYCSTWVPEQEFL